MIAVKILCTVLNSLSEVGYCGNLKYKCFRVAFQGSHYKEVVREIYDFVHYAKSAKQSGPDALSKHLERILKIVDNGGKVIKVSTLTYAEPLKQDFVRY